MYIFLRMHACALSRVRAVERAAQKANRTRNEVEKVEKSRHFGPESGLAGRSVFSRDRSFRVDKYWSSDHEIVPSRGRPRMQCSAMIEQNVRPRPFIFRGGGEPLERL